MEQYPSNTRKPAGASKGTDIPEKNVTSVVKGTAKTKKNDMRKLTDIFISEDAANVKSYIFMDVLVPAIKKAISDIVTNGIDMILYGETGRTKKTSSGSKISYKDYYDRGKRDTAHVRAGTNSSFDYDDIIFDNRGDAEAVLTGMDDIIDQYGFVSVGDLYDLADVSTNNYQVHRYGWTNLSSASVVRANGGYLLKLPRVSPLK